MMGDNNIFFFLNRLVNSHREKKLRQKNQYVMADITDIRPNERFSYYNGSWKRHPYIIDLEYTDSDEKAYQFHSRWLSYNPVGVVNGEQLKVYVDLKRSKYHYVDTNAVLPEDAILHDFRFARDDRYLKDGGKYITATVCGVEYIPEMKFHASLQSDYLKIAEAIGRKYGVPKDKKNRSFLGYMVLCRYDEPDGKTHVFASRGKLGTVDKTYRGQSVKVYFENDKYKHYYVDLESME